MLAMHRHLLFVETKQLKLKKIDDAKSDDITILGNFLKSAEFATTFLRIDTQSQCF